MLRQQGDFSFPKCASSAYWRNRRGKNTLHHRTKCFPHPTSISRASKCCSTAFANVSCAIMEAALRGIDESKSVKKQMKTWRMIRCVDLHHRSPAWSTTWRTETWGRCCITCWTTLIFVSLPQKSARCFQHHHQLRSQLVEIFQTIPLLYPFSVLSWH